MSEYLEAVRAGEEVIVTDRNRPVARLGPVTRETLHDARAMELVRLGLARPASGPLPPDFWSLPRPRDRKGRVLAALLEERAEER